MAMLNTFYIRNLLVRKSTCGIQSLQNYSTTKTTEKSIEESTEKDDSASIVLVQDDIEDEEARQSRIDRIRNKSRLLPQHRNLLMGEVPYPDGPESWVHTTVKYKRMIFGRYGMKSGIDPRICFPSTYEKADKEEYERVAYPWTLQEMMKISADAKKEKLEAVQKREDDIAKKMEKLDVWVNDLNTRVAKKEADAKKAKERKERIIEEVRRHFGYTVDMRDDKFKEMLAQKEKEDKKAQKEARRKQKELKVMEKLITKGKEAENPVENGDQIETNSAKTKNKDPKPE